VRRATGTVHVFTFKEGLLAAAAHDLRLRIEELTCQLEGEALKVVVALDSLRVDGPVREGVVRPDEYDARQRADIERAARREVLRVDRFPTATFDGQAVAAADGYDVRGTLTLAGREGALSFSMKKGDGATYRGGFELQPSRWGIAPYRAMLGTLRVQDRVRIEIAVNEAEG
jgi:hypothetical protein